MTFDSISTAAYALVTWQSVAQFGVLGITERDVCGVGGIDKEMTMPCHPRWDSHSDSLRPGTPLPSPWHIPKHHPEKAVDCSHHAISKRENYSSPSSMAHTPMSSSPMHSPGEDSSFLSPAIIGVRLYLPIGIGCKNSNQMVHTTCWLE